MPHTTPLMEHFKGYQHMTQRKKINPVDLLTSLAWGESEDLEFKSGKGGLPGDLWETYSAMANTQGGVILLGVQNDGSISGIVDTDKIRKQFWDTINNRQKVNRNLLSTEDVQIVSHSVPILPPRHPATGCRSEASISTG